MGYSLCSTWRSPTMSSTVTGSRSAKTGVWAVMHESALPQMRLDSLGAFVAVAEELNMTRAAARLFLSQPALSRRISALEEAVGLILFQRRGQGGSVLTPAGEVLLPYAKMVLAIAVAAQSHIDALRKASTGVSRRTSSASSVPGGERSASELIGLSTPDATTQSARGGRAGLTE